MCNPYDNVMHRNGSNHFLLCVIIPPRSVQLFFKSKSTRRDLRRAVDLNKVVIFGHSYGGDVSNRFFNSKCEAVDSPAVVAPEDVSSQPTFFARVQCEQFSPATVPTTGVLGIVTFEGYVKLAFLTE